MNKFPNITLFFAWENKQELSTGTPCHEIGNQCVDKNDFVFILVNSEFRNG